MRAWIVCALITCGALALDARAAATAQEVPKADEWVTDLADMVSSADEAQLESELEAWKRKTGHEIAVLTVKSLGGRTIEELALNVARTWKLGREGISDAALLVVAKEDREMRIEVLRGLEGVVTDLVAGRIVDDVLTPAFRRGEFSSGIVQAVNALRAAADGDTSALPAQPRHQRVREDRWQPAIFITIVIVVILMRIARAMGMFGHVTSRRRRAFGSFGGWGGHSGSFGGGGGRSFGGGGGGFSGFGGGGGASGGGASGRW